MSDKSTRATIHIQLNFPGKEIFHYETGETSSFDTSPLWSHFEVMECPGNISLGSPEEDYCRLSAEINNILNYFSDLESHSIGTFEYNNAVNSKIIIQGSAQELFTKIFFLLTLESQCTVFRNNQWLRSNYIISNDIERLFYTLFSSFLTKEHYINPEKTINLNLFKEELNLYKEGIIGILNRVRMGVKLSSDSVQNGLTYLADLMTYINLDFDRLYLQLKNKVINDTFKA
ncbi:MAG: hypothetical protein H7A25_05565 [Leptospiraceae bacterium]|nr:hypothetical protein [Leptospiraceae bacterium]MCP5499348.1 hypothetical protein [Leptospiraceae bacterium]